MCRAVINSAWRRGPRLTDPELSLMMPVPHQHCMFSQGRTRFKSAVDSKYSRSDDADWEEVAESVDHSPNLVY